MSEQPDWELDLRLMKILNHLLGTRSVTRTSEIMGVSQSTVSRALAELRTRLDDPLLVKCGAGMVLTHRAEGLREPLQEWLAQGRFLLSPETFEPGQAERDFRIASTDFGVLSVIRPQLRRMTAEAPHCTLTIESLGADSIRRLSTADVDLVITGFDPTGPLYARRLFKEALSCVVRGGHPLASASSPVPLETLLDWPHILVTIAELDVNWLGDALEEAGHQPRFFFRSEGFTLAPHLVAGTDAIATLPTSAALELARIHDLALLDLSIDLGHFQYWLVWHERSKKDAGVRWLVDLLAEGFVPGEIRDPPGDVPGAG